VSDREPIRHHRPDSAFEILESIELLATQDPEAFGEIVVKILCKLAELERDTYEYLMGVMISRELRAAGLKVALEQAKQSLSLGHRDLIAERLSAIEGWACMVEYLGSRERLARLLAPGQQSAAVPPQAHIM
jgi:hypothetical protein